MTRTRIMRMAIVLAALAFGREASAQDDWSEYRSRNYRIVGDADAASVLEVAAHLEAFDDAFERFFRNQGVRPFPPTTVLVLDGSGDLRRVGLNGGDAYFAVGGGKAFAVVTDAGDDESLDGLLHAYFHAVVDARVPNAPRWLKEGMAAFYATTRHSDAGIVTGMPIDRYIRAVRGADRLAGPFGLAEALPEGDAGEESDDVFHAEAWALVHYLITRDGGEGHDRTAELVRRMGAGESFDTASQAAFGTGFREILDGFQSQVAGRGQWPRLTLAAGEGSTDAERVGQVSPMEAATILGEVLYAAGMPLEAERQLGAAAALGPNSSRPYTALAPVLIDQGRFDEVRFGIGRALGGPDADHMAHYYYALSLVLQHEELAGTDRSRVRRELQTAIDKAPAFADAYHLLAATYLDTGEVLDEAARLLETALDLSSGNPEYLVTFSRVLIAEGRFDDARDVLVPLVDPTREPAVVARATAIMQSIEGRTGGRGLVGEGFAEIVSRTGAGDEVAGDPAPLRPAPGEETDGVQLTRVVSGERMPGLLTLIDCRNGLSLTLETDSGSHVFHTDIPDRVDFSGSAGNVGRELVCGVQDPPPGVVVTFRPSGESSEFRGVPDRVEFVED